MQSVSMSCADSRASARSSGRALPGMVPSMAVWQDAASSVCCSPGEYGPLGEIEDASPFRLSLAITHDNGAICVYYEVRQTVSFE
jgi:hypothetical protein